jgi:hypothetical protein
MKALLDKIIRLFIRRPAYAYVRVRAPRPQRDMRRD